MTISPTSTSARTDRDLTADASSSALAASRLYDAEGALHAAHQTHVDAWIAAAGDRLHEAVVDYHRAQAGTGAGSPGEACDQP